MSAHFCSVPSTYAPSASPHFTLTPQPPQPPQLISPIEQAILNLSKLVDNFIEEQRVVNVQANQEIDTVENSLNKELDGIQSELDHKFDNLECSISKLASQQHAHQEGENPEGECLTDTMVEEQCQHQGLSESSYIFAAVCPWEKKEEILPLLSKEDSGEGAVEEHQEHNLHLPSPDPDLVYIFPAAQPTLEAPTTKATPSLPMLQNFKKLVATAQIFATTSKKLTAAHTAWHSGWFGCWFRHGAPGPQHF